MSSSSSSDVMESFSSESTGSLSESSDSGTFSESSESSENVVWYSQLIIQPTRRNLKRLVKQLQIDLNIVDQRYVDLLGPQELTVSFSHDGTFYPADTVVFEDGARPTLVLARQAPTIEDAIIGSWIDQMLGRIRGLLNTARSEGEAYFDISLLEYRIL